MLFMPDCVKAIERENFPMLSQVYRIDFPACLNGMLRSVMKHAIFVLTIARQEQLPGRMGTFRLILDAAFFAMNVRMYVR